MGPLQGFLISLLKALSAAADGKCKGNIFSSAERTGVHGNILPEKALPRPASFSVSGFWKKADLPANI
jgi:hypothetical protein